MYHKIIVGLAGGVICPPKNVINQLDVFKIKSIKESSKRLKDSEHKRLIKTPKA